MPERPGSPVAVLVLPAGRCAAAHAPPDHLGLVGALLCPVHRVLEGGERRSEVGHGVDPLRRGSASRADRRVPGLLEGATLLKRPALSAEKLVDRHRNLPLTEGLAFCRFPC